MAISLEGAYTLLVSHGVDEVPQAVISPEGVTLVAAATESAEEHEDDEEHDDHDEDEEDDDDDGATTQQWIEALVASLIVSMCRYDGFGIW